MTPTIAARAVVARSNRLASSATRPPSRRNQHAGRTALAFVADAVSPARHPDSHAVGRDGRAGGTQQRSSPCPSVGGTDPDPGSVQTPGHDHEAHAVEQRAATWRQLGSIRQRNAWPRFFGQELELLAQAPADDGVVAIEAGRSGFAHRDFLAHPVVDQPFQLNVGRRALPGPGVTRRQVFDLPAGEGDARRVFASPAAAPLDPASRAGRAPLSRAACRDRSGWGCRSRCTGPDRPR